MRSVGHLDSKERGRLGLSWCGNSGRGDDHPTSVYTAPFLLYKMKAFISCLKKKSFKTQQESERREQRLAPYPWNHILTIHVALWGQVRRAVKDQSPPLMAPSQGSSFPGGENLATTTGDLFPKDSEAWRRMLWRHWPLKQSSLISCPFPSLLLPSPWL